MIPIQEYDTIKYPLFTAEYLTLAVFAKYSCKHGT